MALPLSLAGTLLLPIEYTRADREVDMALTLPTKISEMPYDLRRMVYASGIVFVLQIGLISLDLLATFGPQGPAAFHAAKTFRWVESSYPTSALYLVATALYALTAYGVSSYVSRSSLDRITAINLSSCVVRLSLDGTVLGANKLFRECLGYGEKELVGKEHRELVPTYVRDSKGYQDFWTQLRSGKFVSGTFERIAKNGESKWFLCHYTPIRNGNGLTYEIMKIAFDVTDAHNASIELTHKNTYLEHAAKILRHDMHSGINTYLPRAIRALDKRLPEPTIEEFRLQTPLKLLREGLQHTQRVYRGVKEFTNLVRSGVELEKNPHDLNDILTTYLDATSYKSQVVLEELPVLTVNEPLFCTAIDNLIRNGLKYNDSPTKLVTLKMLDETTLAVVDNGRGMSQKDFDLYSRPYARKEGQKESGTGLGLNICIAILHEHGFSVKCTKLREGALLVKNKIHGLGGTQIEITVR